MSPRVLLVEDHAIIKQALALALEQAGLTVESTASVEPEAVLKQAEAFRPAVVLLDFYLGEADSLPMIGPLQALGAQVVVLTGTTDPRSLGACLEEGAVGVVSKAESLDRVARAIADAVDGSAVMRPAERDALLDAARRARADERERLAPFASLTARERQVLAHLMQGHSAEDVSRIEFVSLATVRSQIRGILQKLDVNSQLAAVTLAQQAGWALDR
ncbi:MAG TPA: response regulator transcription factor [Acidimicrobiales bacterium]|nr:response regulator transcription factor [Acidimicrobiales bacterium]